MPRSWSSGRNPSTWCAPESLNDLWRRHILDSAQLRAFLPPEVRSLVDMGSGAGFPGLVLAILGVPDVHLIESDARKCVFLAEAARAAGLDGGAAIRIIHRRAAGGDRVDLRGGCRDGTRLRAAARSFWPMPSRSCKPDSICLFPKGGRVDEELTEAEKTWRMTVEQFPSLSDPSGTILRMKQVARAGL